MHKREDEALPEGAWKLLFTYGEAAAATGISSESIKRLVRSGQIRAMRLGRLVKIPLTELEAWIERQLVEQPFISYPAPGEVASTEQTPMPLKFPGSYGAREGRKRGRPYKTIEQRLGEEAEEAANRGR